jgi:hypothetical protein
MIRTASERLLSLVRQFTASALVVASVVTVTHAQAVRLQIKPRVGDTLRLRIEQDWEISRVGKVRDADTTMTMRSSTLMQSRSIVVQSDNEGVVVRFITDSVAVDVGGMDPQLASLADRERRALQGKELRVRFSPQGSATVIEADPEIPRNLQSVSSQLPATFPRHPVSVGSTWKQRIPIPDAIQGQFAGTLEAMLRLDSLTHRGKRAYISMRGTFTRDSAAPPIAAGARLLMSGTVTGFMILDRARGWVTDASLEMFVRSHTEPTPGSSVPPMRLQMRLVQRQRTMDKM